MPSINRTNDVKLRIVWGYRKFVRINPSSDRKHQKNLKILQIAESCPFFFAATALRLLGIGYPIEDRIKPGLDGALGRCARQPSDTLVSGIG